MRLFLPLLAAIFTVFLSQSAAARCYGKDLYETTSSEFKASIQGKVARIPFANGRYFKVSKNGKTSWIIGTIHASDSRVSKIPRFFRDKIKSSSRVYVESTEAQSEEYIKLLNETAGELDITEDTDASKHFTAEEWSIIQKEARLYGLPNYLHRYIPLGLIAELVTSPKCDRQTSRFLDANIERLANRSKKPVGSLDNVKMMVKQELSNPWPDKTMVQLIKLEIPRMHLRAHHVETTIQMYLSDRVTTYMEFSNALTRSYLPKKMARLMNEDYHRAVIVDRNKYWMKTLVPSLTQGNVVVAFGAAHLSGKQGILRFLQQRGFKIEALTL